MSSRFQWLNKLEFINELVSKPSVPGLVATIVLIVVLWVLLSLFFRNNWASKELRVISASNFQLSQTNANAQSLFTFIQNTIKQFNGSLLQERFQLVLQNLQGHNASDKASTLLGGQSGVDSSHIHSGYGPLRALVWALPGLGFMGTAFEMASSIGGLGTALTTTQDYSGLRNILVSNVVPHLAGAFDITIFALGSSVIMFLLLSLVFHREEKAIFNADALCLKIIARIQDVQITPNAAFGTEHLSGDMRVLSQQLNLLSSAISQVNQSNVGEQLNMLAVTLSQVSEGNSSLYQHLDAINKSLSIIQQQVSELKNNADKDQEFVIRRMNR
jgi:hypothetical protein